MKFTCEKCGACCRAVGCSLLTEDNLCPIYEDRPSVCRYGYAYHKLCLHETMTKEDHAEICLTNQRFQASEIAGKHDVVMSEIKHLRDGQRVVKDDIKTILGKLGG